MHINRGRAFVAYSNGGDASSPKWVMREMVPRFKEGAAKHFETPTIPETQEARVQLTHE